MTDDAGWVEQAEISTTQDILSTVYDDPEIEAMYRIKTALTPLDKRARERVLQWVADCLNVTVEFIARMDKNE